MRMAGTTAFILICGFVFSGCSSVSKLNVAAEKGDLAQAKQLIAKGADVNAKSRLGESSLHIAAENGHLEIVRLLIANGADVNAISKYGGTSLHEAASNGHLEIAKLLIANSANVNSISKYGGMSLHEAAGKGHLEIAKLLIANGADVNAMSKYGGGTSLRQAAINGHLEIAKLLITYGADVNAQTKNGTTSLYEASEKNHKQIVELLLANGADLNPAGGSRVPPVRAALQKGNIEISRFLIARGATFQDRNETGDEMFTTALLRWIAANESIRYGRKKEALEHLERSNIFFDNASVRFRAESEQHAAEAKSLRVRETWKKIGNTFLVAILGAAQDYQARTQHQKLAQIRALKNARTYNDYFSKVGAYKPPKTLLLPSHSPAVRSGGSGAATIAEQDYLTKRTNELSHIATTLSSVVQGIVQCINRTEIAILQNCYQSVEIGFQSL